MISQVFSWEVTDPLPFGTFGESIKVPFSSGDMDLLPPEGFWSLNLDLLKMLGKSEKISSQMVVQNVDLPW